MNLKADLLARININLVENGPQSINLETSERNDVPDSHHETSSLQEKNNKSRNVLHLLILRVFRTSRFFLWFWTAPIKGARTSKLSWSVDQIDKGVSVEDTSGALLLIRHTPCGKFLRQRCTKLVPSKKSDRQGKSKYVALPRLTCSSRKTEAHLAIYALSTSPRHLLVFRMHLLNGGHLFVSMGRLDRSVAEDLTAF